MTLDRRGFFNLCTRAGVASTLLPGVLYTLVAQAEESSPKKLAAITPELLDKAAEMAGVSLTSEQVKMMLAGLKDQRDSYDVIRKLKIPNSVAPAYVFNPIPPGFRLPRSIGDPIYGMNPTVEVSANLEDLAFKTVRELGELVRTRKVTSLALTEMYLARLKRYDEKLHCVITLTEERALAQAKAADTAIAAGRYFGPLHGLPWGAKDLLAVKGYRTTWGAGGFEQQQFDEDATVVQRLDATGAVLIAKLSLGALAMGDKWFGGRTRNPWNTKLGSSGSSAGSACATASGCVAFAIGSETLGSISSPSTRCGTSGLRPTFGYVPRTGAMALSWTMDKLGPICRSIEDCAIVLQDIHGPDGRDLATLPVGYHWNADFDWRTLRIGYLKSEFDLLPPMPAPKPAPAKETATAKKDRIDREHLAADAYARRVYDQRFDKAALKKLEEMGVKLIPVELPKLPYNEMVPLLTAEAAAAFDDLTMTGRDKLLTEQGIEDWPNLFRIARFYPAVEYIQANRARALAIREFAKIFEKVDVIVAPTLGDQLTATNLTGHPSAIIPNGFRGNDAPQPPAIDTGDDDNVGGPGTPVSLTFLGGLYQDAKLCSFVRAYQEATGFHKNYPKL